MTDELVNPESTQALAACWPQPVAAARYPGADRHPVAVYLARLAEGSRRTMRQAIETIARILSAGELGAEALPWHGLRYQHTAAVRASLAAKYAPATANKMLAALRGVLRECWRLGLIDAETFQRSGDLELVRGSVLPAGRGLDAGEVRALFVACARDVNRPAGARDAALLAVLYGGGLRRSEAVALDVADFDRETGALVVRAGKGRKARTVYATNGGRSAVEAWLAVRGAEAGPLFLPVNKAGAVALRRLTAQAVLQACDVRAAKAGVASFSPHDLRRTFIGDMLDAGADLATVQKLAGHANPQTTARYDRRGERAKRKAVELLHVPYVGACRAELS